MYSEEHLIQLYLLTNHKFYLFFAPLIYFFLTDKRNQKKTANYSYLAKVKYYDWKYFDQNICALSHLSLSLSISIILYSSFMLMIKL